MEQKSTLATSSGDTSERSLTSITTKPKPSLAASKTTKQHTIATSEQFTLVKPKSTATTAFTDALTTTANQKRAKQTAYVVMATTDTVATMEMFPTQVMLTPSTMDISSDVNILSTKNKFPTPDTTKSMTTTPTPTSMSVTTHSIQSRGISTAKMNTMMSPKTEMTIPSTMVFTNELSRGRSSLTSPEITTLSAGMSDAELTEVKSRLPSTSSPARSLNSEKIISTEKTTAKLRMPTPTQKSPSRRTQTGNSLAQTSAKFFTTGTSTISTTVEKPVTSAVPQLSSSVRSGTSSTAQPITDSVTAMMSPKTDMTIPSTMVFTDELLGRRTSLTSPEIISLSAGMSGAEVTEVKSQLPSTISPARSLNSEKIISTEKTTTKLRMPTPNQKSTSRRTQNGNSLAQTSAKFFTTGTPTISTTVQKHVTSAFPQLSSSVRSGTLSTAQPITDSVTSSEDSNVHKTTKHSVPVTPYAFTGIDDSDSVNSTTPQTTFATDDLSSLPSTSQLSTMSVMSRASDVSVRTTPTTVSSLITYGLERQSTVMSDGYYMSHQNGITDAKKKTDSIFHTTAKTTTESPTVTFTMSSHPRMNSSFRSMSGYRSTMQLNPNTSKFARKTTTSQLPESEAAATTSIKVATVPDTLRTANKNMSFVTTSPVEVAAKKSSTRPTMPHHTSGDTMASLSTVGSFLSIYTTFHRSQTAIQSSVTGTETALSSNVAKQQRPTRHVSMTDDYYTLRPYTVVDLEKTTDSVHRTAEMDVMKSTAAKSTLSLQPRTHYSFSNTSGYGSVTGTNPITSKAAHKMTTSRLTDTVTTTSVDAATVPGTSTTGDENMSSITTLPDEAAKTKSSTSATIPRQSSGDIVASLSTSGTFLNTTYYAPQKSIQSSITGSDTTSSPNVLIQHTPSYRGSTSDGYYRPWPYTIAYAETDSRSRVTATDAIKTTAGEVTVTLQPIINSTFSSKSPMTTNSDMHASKAVQKMTTSQLSDDTVTTYLEATKVPGTLTAAEEHSMSFDTTASIEAAATKASMSPTMLHHSTSDAIGSLSTSGSSLNIYSTSHTSQTSIQSSITDTNTASSSSVVTQTQPTHRVSWPHIRSEAKTTTVPFSRVRATGEIHRKSTAGEVSVTSQPLIYSSFSSRSDYNLPTLVNPNTSKAVYEKTTSQLNDAAVTTSLEAASVPGTLGTADENVASVTTLPGEAVVTKLSTSLTMPHQSTSDVFGSLFTSRSYGNINTTSHTSETSIQNSVTVTDTALSSNVVTQHRPTHLVSTANSYYTSEPYIVSDAKTTTDSVLRTTEIGATKLTAAEFTISVQPRINSSFFSNMSGYSSTTWVNPITSNAVHEMTTSQSIDARSIISVESTTVSETPRTVDENLSSVSTLPVKSAATKLSMHSTVPHQSAAYSFSSGSFLAVNTTSYESHTSAQSTVTLVNTTSSSDAINVSVTDFPLSVTAQRHTENISAHTSSHREYVYEQNETLASQTTAVYSSQTKSSIIKPTTLTAGTTRPVDQTVHSKKAVSFATSTWKEDSEQMTKQPTKQDLATYVHNNSTLNHVTDERVSYKVPSSSQRFTMLDITTPFTDTSSTEVSTSKTSAIPFPSSKFPVISTSKLAIETSDIDDASTKETTFKQQSANRSIVMTSMPSTVDASPLITTLLAGISTTPISHASLETASTLEKTIPSKKSNISSTESALQQFTSTYNVENVSSEMTSVVQRLATKLTTTTYPTADFSPVMTTSSDISSRFATKSDVDMTKSETTSGTHTSSELTNGKSSSTTVSSELNPTSLKIAWNSVSDLATSLTSTVPFTFQSSENMHSDTILSPVHTVKDSKTNATVSSTTYMTTAYKGSNGTQYSTVQNPAASSTDLHINSTLSTSQSQQSLMTDNQTATTSFTTDILATSTTAEKDISSGNTQLPLSVSSEISFTSQLVRDNVTTSNDGDLHKTTKHSETVATYYAVTGTDGNIAMNSNTTLQTTFTTDDLSGLSLLSQHPTTPIVSGDYGEILNDTTTISSLATYGIGDQSTIISDARTTSYEQPSHTMSPSPDKDNTMTYSMPYGVITETQNLLTRDLNISSVDNNSSYMLSATTVNSVNISTEHITNMSSEGTHKSTSSVTHDPFVSQQHLSSAISFTTDTSTHSNTLAFTTPAAPTSEHTASMYASSVTAHHVPQSRTQSESVGLLTMQTTELVSGADVGNNASLNHTTERMSSEVSSNSQHFNTLSVPLATETGFGPKVSISTTPAASSEFSAMSITTSEVEDISTEDTTFMQQSTTTFIVTTSMPSTADASPYMSSFSAGILTTQISHDFSEMALTPEMTTASLESTETSPMSLSQLLTSESDVEDISTETTSNRQQSTAKMTMNTHSTADISAEVTTSLYTSSLIATTFNTDITTAETSSGTQTSSKMTSDNSLTVTESGQSNLTSLEIASNSANDMVTLSTSAVSHDFASAKSTHLETMFSPAQPDSKTYATVSSATSVTTASYESLTRTQYSTAQSTDVTSKDTYIVSTPSIPQRSQSPISGDQATTTPFTTNMSVISTMIQKDVTSEITQFPSSIWSKTSFTSQLVLENVSTSNDSNVHKTSKHSETVTPYAVTDNSSDVALKYTKKTQTPSTADRSIIPSISQHPTTPVVSLASEIILNNVTTASTTISSMTTTSLEDRSTVMHDAVTTSSEQQPHDTSFSAENNTSVTSSMVHETQHLSVLNLNITSSGTYSTSTLSATMANVADSSMEHVTNSMTSDGTNRIRPSTVGQPVVSQQHISSSKTSFLSDSTNSTTTLAFTAPEVPASDHTASMIAATVTANSMPQSRTLNNSGELTIQTTSSTYVDKNSAMSTITERRLTSEVPSSGQHLTTPSVSLPTESFLINHTAAFTTISSLLTHVSHGINISTFDTVTPSSKNSISDMTPSVKTDIINSSRDLSLFTKTSQFSTAFEGKSESLAAHSRTTTDDSFTSFRRTENTFPPNTVTDTKTKAYSVFRTIATGATKNATTEFTVTLHPRTNSGSRSRPMSGVDSSTMQANQSATKAVQETTTSRPRDATAASTPAAAATVPGALRTAYKNISSMTTLLVKVAATEWSTSATMPRQSDASSSSSGSFLSISTTSRRSPTSAQTTVIRDIDTSSSDAVTSHTRRVSMTDFSPSAPAQLSTENISTHTSSRLENVHGHSETPASQTVAVYSSQTHSSVVHPTTATTSTTEPGEQAVVCT